MGVCAAAAAQDRAWIERSDRNTAMVFDVLGAFYPEWMSSLGIEKFDTAVNDLKPGYVKRIEAALAAQIGRLAAAKQKESDRRVREDLDIVIEALERNRRTNALEYRLRLDFQDLPRNLFTGLQGLLDERNAPERRQHALGRLRAYAGLEPGTVPIAQLARDRIMERADAKLLWPYRGEVEQQLNNCERYLAGIAELFRASPVKGWEAPYERLAAQVRDYCGWVKSTVLPRARGVPTLPRALYADRLLNVGVDISPEQAIALGTTTFAEVRDEMAMLAADIARERKLPSADYRDVLRALKRDVVPDDRLMPYYRERLADIERIIERERLLTLPKRQASIRLASEAESAAIPAPYLNVPRLIGNRGEVGEFVLPLTNPNSKSGKRADDFTSPAAAWALTAHEARPGHELQFAAMVERGVSLARAVFASNSTNSEGWALYAEAIVLPHFPPEGRLFGLQMRLMRAAREFLDPMVNLGRLSPEAAKEFLMREVTLSEPLAQQEADRYAFWSPGQAVSYLYGYSRLRELRLKAEIALGEKFDPREFHDLIIEQGLLPPRLLESAVMAELTRRYPGKSKAPELGRSSDSRSPKGAPTR
jgi:hypothetical protein